jgi:hypothetical protein
MRVLMRANLYAGLSLLPIAWRDLLLPATSDPPTTSAPLRPWRGARLPLSLRELLAVAACCATYDACVIVIYLCAGLAAA